jgi:hypothetical protein
VHPRAVRKPLGHSRSREFAAPPPQAWLQQRWSDGMMFAGCRYLCPKNRGECVRVGETEREPGYFTMPELAELAELGALAASKPWWGLTRWVGD